MLHKTTVYVATVTYNFYSTAIYTDVLCVTESQIKAFEAIESNDHMKIVKEETVAGRTFEEGKRRKYIGIDNGRATYSENIHVNVSDDDCGCDVMYEIIEMEFA